MAKPSVDPNTLIEKTSKTTGNWDPRFASTEQGVESDCAGLSYLKGAIGSGSRDHAFEAPASQWDAIQELRRHTVDQGFATYTKAGFQGRRDDI